MNDLYTLTNELISTFGLLNKKRYTAMRKILLALCLLLPLVAAAQSYTIKHLDMRQGLSNNHVVSIAQDKRGILWFATEEGLNKFDGINFSAYYEENNEKQSITGNGLNCVFDDPKDSILWIGTQRDGLNAYNYANDTFTAYQHDPNNPESLITDDITQIIAANDSNLFISTYWGGVEYLDKKTGKFTHYNATTVPGFPNNGIWAIEKGEDDILYIGHAENGFSILSTKNKTIKNYIHDPNDPNSLPSNEVGSICRDRNGNIWVGTGKGLALFNPETGKFIRFNDKDKNLSYRIHTIRQLHDNQLWIGMEFGGIAIMDLSQHMFHSPVQCQLTVIKEDRGVSQLSIRSLFQDTFGNIWAGSWGGGIKFINPNPPLFSLYQYSPFPFSEGHLTSQIVTSVCIDHQNNLWVGLSEGEINLFNNGKQIAFYNKQNKKLPEAPIQASFCDSKGGLWFGFFYGGILYCDPQTHNFRQVFPPAQSNADVRAFFEDKEGNIWTSTSEGIYLIDRNSKRVKAHYGSTNDLVRCVVKDSEGQLWVGYFGGGLGIYDKEFNVIAFFNVSNEFPSNTLNALYEDSKGRMWAATGDGLVCFPSLKERKYKVYRRENGLYNTHIQAINEDRNGNIWFSTNNGISCLCNDGNTLYNYDQHDNLPIANFSRNCTAKDPAGHIYFGSIDGLCSFNPEKVLQKRQAPAACINYLIIHKPTENIENRPVIIPLYGHKNIELEHWQNTFSVAFNVQNYALIDQVEYAYMLKGLENAWYTVTDIHNLTFRNLSPGKYQLQIKTRMRNQPWDNNISTLNIYITPPLWLTWWAKAIYFVLIASVVIILFYIYKKRLDAETLYKIEKQNLQHEQELNNERLRFYTNITHELRTPLTLILGPLEDMQKDNSLSAKDAQKLNVIHQSAMRLLNLINQILEFRKTETQNRKLCVCRSNIATLVHETGLKYRELNRKQDVEIKLDIQREDITIYFDKEMIQTILDNLISNAIKYTEKGCITIGIRLTERAGVSYTLLWVSDTGYGIHPDALSHIFDRYYQEGGKHQASGTGIGLALVKNLVKLHEGEISVESKLNQGSTFCVSLLTDNFYPNALHTDVQQQNETDKPIEQESEPNANERPILLVVEDNQDIRDYIAESFGNQFDVRTATNGKEGMDTALKVIPDIIVSDIMMPEMDGNEMCRTLKADVRTCHIPIILLTAKDSLHDKEEGYAVGADSYLTKPFSASLLHSRIENLIQSRRILSEHFRNQSGESASKSAAVMESLNKLDNEFIRKINELIEARLSSDKIDVGYLSDKMCMSSSTLYRKMKALTGMSANEYVRKMKMKYAEQFLLEGKYTISEIAVKVGINNLFYFRQCFKEEYGMIPSEYLKHLRGNPDNQPS